MSDTLLAILIVGAAAAGIFLLLFLKNRSKKKKIEESAVLTVNSEVQQRARQGVPSPLVASDRNERPELLDAIHRAVIEKIADAQALGFDAGLDPSEYIVYVIEPDREYDSYGNYVPNFLIRGALNYDGTDWDQDPRPGHASVWAAEYVIMNGNSPSNEWVVARYTRDWDTLFAAAGNGLDHILQFKNRHIPGHEGDYDRDLTHVASAHPLIPPRIRGLVARRKPKVDCQVVSGVEVAGRIRGR